MIVTLPAVTLPKVYILSPVRTLAALILPEDTISSVVITLPTFALPDVYKLPPLITLVAVTLPEENILSSAITLPPLTLPDAVKISGSKVPITDKLPPITFPKVYILPPVRSLVAVTFPEDITSSIVVILPTFAFPRV